MIIQQSNLSCTLNHIVQDMPLQIWEASTTLSTGNLPLWLIRALQNKPRYLVTDLTQCYFHYLSPYYWYHRFGIVWLLVLLFAVLFVIKSGYRIKWLVLIVVLLFPIGMIMGWYH